MTKYIVFFVVHFLGFIFRLFFVGKQKHVAVGFLCDKNIFASTNGTGILKLVLLLAVSVEFMVIRNKVPMDFIFRFLVPSQQA